MKAPNFKLTSTSGKVVELNKVKSKFIIIYFYPKDNTSGCTIETNDFNKLLSKFEKLGCTIFGISKDILSTAVTVCSPTVKVVLRSFTLRSVLIWI